MVNFRQPWIRLTLLTLFYISVLIGLFAIYSSGSFKTPAFIYQGF
jgi:hypothetical protein